MRTWWYIVFHWYEVQAPDGFTRLEWAVNENEARRQAAKIPGYEPEDALQVQERPDLPPKHPPRRYRYA